jgi:hypothetical protein
LPILKERLEEANALALSITWGTSWFLIDCGEQHLSLLHRGFGGGYLRQLGRELVVVYPGAADAWFYRLRRI